MESVILECQAEYCRALATADKAAQSTPFNEFLLSALREVVATDQVTDQVSDQVKALLKYLGTRTLSAMECMKKLGLSHRPSFGQAYLQSALEVGLIERTLPDKPNSRLQKYRRVSN